MKNIQNYIKEYVKKPMLIYLINGLAIGFVAMSVFTFVADVAVVYWEDWKVIR